MTTEAQALITEIDELLEDGRRDWTVKLLQNVRATIRRTGVATTIQRQLVTKLTPVASDEAQLPSERAAERRSRRYEGFERARS